MQQKIGTKEKKGKGKEKAQDDAASVDSMEVDEEFGIGEVVEVDSEDDEPMPKKKKSTTSSRKPTTPKKAVKAPAKKQPAKKATVRPTSKATKKSKKRIASEARSFGTFRHNCADHLGRSRLKRTIT